MRQRVPVRYGHPRPLFGTGIRPLSVRRLDPPSRARATAPRATARPPGPEYGEKTEGIPRTGSETGAALGDRRRRAGAAPEPGAGFAS